jgi:serine protease inhibitor
LKRVGAHVENVDFSDTQKSCEIINGAVAKQTEGKIKELISPDALSGRDQIMVLTNAMYFKEAWNISFDKAKTTKGKFYKCDGSTTQAQFMYAAGRYRGASNENFTALEFPYKNNQFSMLFIVPKGNLGDFEAQYLTHQGYINWGFIEATLRRSKSQQLR